MAPTNPNSDAAAANTGVQQAGTLSGTPMAPAPAGATNRPPGKPPKPPQGSTAEPVYGRRRVKHYSVNDSDLAQLSTYGGLASWSFGLGTLLVGTSIDLIRQLIANKFAPPAMPVSPEDAFWSGSQWVLLGSGILFVIIALFLVTARHNKASQIKKETQFLQ